MLSPPNGKICCVSWSRLLMRRIFLVPVFFGQPDSPTIRLCKPFLVHGVVARPKNMAAWWPLEEKVEQQFQRHMFGEEIAFIQLSMRIPSRSSSASNIRIPSQLQVNIIYLTNAINNQFHETNCHFNTRQSGFLRCFEPNVYCFNFVGDTFNSLA